MTPPDVSGRGRPRQETATTHRTDNSSVTPLVDQSPSPVWIVTTSVSGGRSRRFAFLTSAGAARAAERHREAGRPAEVSRAKIDPAVRSRTSHEAQPERQVDQDLLHQRRAETVTRIAWLRHSADLLYSFDESGLLSANLRDLAYVLEAQDERGCGR